MVDPGGDAVLADVAAPAAGCPHAAASATSTPRSDRPAADVFMRKLLRIPDDRAKGSRSAANREANKAFSTSIAVSAVRCILTYVVLPFVAPLLGIAGDVGPWLGIPIGIAAIVCNVLSMRRFWAADHKLRWAYTAIATVVIGFLLVLMASDAAELLS